MQDHPLRCDGCTANAGHDGALVFVLQHGAPVQTVRSVRVACGACGPASLRTEPPDTVTSFTFVELGDVFDFADRIIPQHDWERGTVQQLARVLVALHQLPRAQ